MDMPDEKMSGMYGIKKEDDEDVVESLALEDNNFSKPKPNLPSFGLNQNTSQSVLGGGAPLKLGSVQPKLLGPNFMK